MKRMVRTLLGRIGGKRADPREAIHFLHIGKCAGTQVGRIAAEVNVQSPTLRFVKHKHRVTLDDLAPDARYFFAIRDPASRFRSGFYSRQRRGRPYYDHAWSAGEERAFTRFAQANDLAEALFSPGERGRDAFCAMRSIHHAAQNQVDWFGRNGDFLFARPPVWILRQEHFSQDLAVLSDRLGIDLGAIIASQQGEIGPVHASDYGDAPPLSAAGKANLARWYAQDAELYRLCEWWITDQLARA